MKAVRLVEIGQPLVAAEVETPQPAAGEILVRVGAAGICHSDAHYRSGQSPTDSLPIAMGHEVAGTVEQLGEGVTTLSVGDRVALDYLVTCGKCHRCNDGDRQFCETGKMLGKHRAGGYAEYVCVPVENAVPVPNAVPLEAAALMMCSSSTSLHALHKARHAAGESVAVFGVGGLGMSAIQLARVLEAKQIFAVDIDPDRLALAKEMGAIPINAQQIDPVVAIAEQTEGHGVDVALELIGLPITMQQAVQCLAVHGRAALVGITQEGFTLTPYDELINKEAEVIGVSDHMASDLPQLLAWAAEGHLDFSNVITERVPLEANAINAVLDRLERHGSGVRAVIVPQ